MTEETRQAIEQAKECMDTNPQQAVSILHDLEDARYLGLTTLNDLDLLIELLEG